MLKALENPNTSVRFEALTRLKKFSNKLYPIVKKAFILSNNIYYQARLVWLLGYCGKRGKAFVRNLLFDKNIHFRITALRTLKNVDSKNYLRYLKDVSSDKSLAMKREVLLSLRDVSFSQSKDLIKKMIPSYNGNNRYYLEAIGVACTNKEEQVYTQILRPIFLKIPYEKWTSYHKNLIWRLHSKTALQDLKFLFEKANISIDEFRRLILAFTFFQNEEQRRKNITQLEEILLFSNLSNNHKMVIKEVITKDLQTSAGVLLTQSYLVPKTFGIKTKLSSIEQISKLQANVQRGKVKSALCLSCHKINGRGVAFGPNLSSWGKHRTILEIVTDIVEPNKRLAHGYETVGRVKRRRFVAEGLLANYSHHAGRVKLKLFGGQFKTFKFREGGSRYKKYNKSLMPSASQMGLSNQDVRDIAQYLKQGTK